MARDRLTHDSISSAPGYDRTGSISSVSSGGDSKSESAAARRRRAAAGAGVGVSGVSPSPGAGAGAAGRGSGGSGGGNTPNQWRGAYPITAPTSHANTL